MFRRKMLTLALSALFLCTSAKPQSSVEVVLARCRENIDWIDEMGYAGITTVYDKCRVTTGPGRHIERPNMGRESGTYLQHIVDNYDNLADWTVFTQAEKPTYGYRGHRLGGGHMMRNVLFQDYVEAAETREQNPLFFVFTSVLVSNKQHVYQCIRSGYGEEYTKPTGESFPQKMCGALDDWQQWYEFPQWFSDMLQRLQQEQSAPVTNFDVAKAFEIFSIQPNHGVTFFAQGARFAASREAIQARPKAYYEGILEHLQQQDPWAGYYLEWMWYYVLGGTDAPCGFEEPVLNGHLTWERTAKGREDFQELQTQTISGVSGGGSVTLNNASNEVIFKGPVILPSFALTNPNAQVTIQSGGSLNVQGAFNVQAAQGSIIATGATLIIEGIANIVAQSMLVETLQLKKDSVIDAVLEVTGALTLGSTVEVILTIKQGGKFTKVSGKATVKHTAAGKVLSLISTEIGKDIKISPGASSRRQGDARVLYDTSLIPTYFCATNSTGSLSISTGTVAIINLGCAVTVSGYTQYSSLLGTTTASGGYLYPSSITSSAMPAYASTLNNPSSMTIDYRNVTASGTFCANVLVYGPANGSSCATSIPYTCSGGCSQNYITTDSSSTYGSGKCLVQYCQTTGSSDNNGGLYGLIALVAIVPLAGLAAFGAWYFLKSPTEAAPAAYNQYYYPEPYPQAAYPQAAYPAYPQYAPYGAEAYPFQGGFYAPGVQAPMPTPAGFASL